MSASHHLYNNYNNYILIVVSHMHMHWFSIRLYFQWLVIVLSLYYYLLSCCLVLALLHIGDEWTYTMAMMFGKLEEFDMATGKDWTQYIERMEYYFQANKITEGDTKRAILISAMGEKAYKLWCAVSFHLQNLTTNLLDS